MITFDVYTFNFLIKRIFFQPQYVVPAYIKKNRALWIQVLSIEIPNNYSRLNSIHQTIGKLECMESNPLPEFKNKVMDWIEQNDVNHRF